MGHGIIDKETLQLVSGVRGALCVGLFNMIHNSSDLILRPATRHDANQIGRLHVCLWPVLAVGKKHRFPIWGADAHACWEESRGRAAVQPCPAHWVTVLVVDVFYDRPSRLSGVLADYYKRYLYRCTGNAIIATSPSWTGCLRHAGQIGVH